MTNQITATMPKELKEKWLAALRNGEFKQCKHLLFDGEGYCCLGVLQKVADGYVEKNSDGHSLPSSTMGWADAHDIVDVSAPSREWFNPFLPTLINTEGQRYHSCASANDSGKTFREIADALDIHMQGV